jgi:hypothetical protein
MQITCVSKGAGRPLIDRPLQSGRVIELKASCFLSVHFNYRLQSRQMTKHF